MEYQGKACGGSETTTCFLWTTDSVEWKSSCMGIKKWTSHLKSSKVDFSLEDAPTNRSKHLLGEGNHSWGLFPLYETTHAGFWFGFPLWKWSEARSEHGLSWIFSILGTRTLRKKAVGRSYLTGFFRDFPHSQDSRRRAALTAWINASNDKQLGSGRSKV